MLGVSHGQFEEYIFVRISHFSWLLFSPLRDTLYSHMQQVDTMHQEVLIWLFLFLFMSLFSFTLTFFHFLALSPQALWGDCISVLHLSYLVISGFYIRAITICVYIPLYFTLLHTCGLIVFLFFYSCTSFHFIYIH